MERSCAGARSRQPSSRRRRLLSFLIVRSLIFAALCFTTRIAIDGPFVGLSADLVMRAGETTLFATVAYGALRGTYAWVRAED